MSEQIQEQATNNSIASFSPEIAKLVIFNQKSKLHMQQRTQTQIHREYESIKQAMLTGSGIKEEHDVESTPIK